MAIFYLDTSAFLKRYRTEKGTELVGALFSNKAPDHVFVTSHFTGLEVDSVAARALKGRLLNPRAYGILLRLFAEDLEQHVIVLPVSTALISEAADVARRHAVKAADAVHMATALRVKQAAPKEVVFVTSDKELLRASEAGGFTVLDPEAEDALDKLQGLRERRL